LHYGHHYQLPEEITQNTQLNLLSDFRYPYDYPDDFPIYGGERALESRFTIAKNTELTHSSLDASYYLNILKSDPLNGRKGSLLSGNGDAIHRAPELRYSIVNSQIENTGILVHSDVNYVHFARQDFAYDDIIQETCQPGTCIDPTRGNSPGHVGTGQFDPQRDALRTGDRFDFQPEFSYPFQIGKIFDIVPAVSYRFTQYNFDVSPDNPSQTPSFAEDPQVIGYNTHPTRSYFKESLSTRTRFGKVWGTDPTNPKEIKYKHEFIPEIMLSTLSGMNETQSAFFGKNDSTPAFLIDQPITDSEIFDPVHRKPLQFDYNDRVVNRNVLTGVLTNKIVRKSWKGAPTASNNPDLKANKITDADEAEYLQVVGVKVWQSYDFDAATATPQFPWSDIDALLDFRFNHFESNLLLRYFPYHNVTNSSIRSRIYDSLNNFLQVTYNQSFLITENLNDVTTGPNPHSESIGLGAGIVRRYFKLFGDINITPRDFKDNYFINVWNAQLNITPPGNCWGVGLHFVHAYNGDGTQSTISFDYQFGGGTPTPINTSSEAPANPLNNPINNPANTGAKI
jgi:LPS-assembly protein